VKVRYFIAWKGGENASFCQRVPRLRPLVILIRAIRSEDVRIVRSSGLRQGTRDFDYLN
jgi:hypothetical protein